MGLIDKVTQPTQPDYSLDKKEIELLLSLIKDSTFRGEHIEVLYHLVYKLQQQHLNKN